MSKARSRRLATVAAAALVFSPVGAGTALGAAHQPGTDRHHVGISKVAFGSIDPVVKVTGNVSSSVDATGITASTGTLQVDKPAGATVRAAYLMTATTGFSQHDVQNDEITLNGATVSFASGIVTPSGIGSSNGFANVTSMVKSTLDAAPAGVVDVSYGETDSGNYDGSELVVIFDDPNQSTTNTIQILFGAQQTTGDDFNIGLADPIDKSDPNLKLDMSLGISYGFQGTAQFSTVDVNGQRMTSSAGGQDDGDDSNGTLITAGGVGDSNANPADPNAAPTDPRSDDELYSLLPFVNNGDTSIKVHTLNPSNDDNIFGAVLTLNSQVAVVGEGITLSPPSATNPVGQQHTVIAKVQDAQGSPVTGREVVFTVMEGPNTGLNGTATTGSTDPDKGVATFSYTSTTTGTDVIIASFTDSTGKAQSSNQVFKAWVPATTDSPTRCTVTALRAGPPAQQDVTVLDPDGVAAITNVHIINGTVAVPSFTGGTTSPIVVTASKGDRTKRTFWEFDVTDSLGNTTHCV